MGNTLIRYTDLCSESDDERDDFYPDDDNESDSEDHEDIFRIWASIKWPKAVPRKNGLLNTIIANQEENMKELSLENEMLRKTVEKYKRLYYDKSEELDNLIHSE